LWFLPTHADLADPEVTISLLLVNAFTDFALLSVIAREVWLVFQARRRGQAAARLHVRIVGLFSVIAAAPAIWSRWSRT
jgi:two-component system nitrogen regulation sensor histidine kinase NtrY